MPGLIIIIAATGVIALVVQEALVVIFDFARVASLTLDVAVIVSFSSWAGAESTTLLAPASRYAFAFS